MNIGESGNIFVERAHPAYDHVIDFLVSCCEPVSRTQVIEQYRLDSASLSAATAEGTYTLDMIDTVLRHFRLNAAQELPIDLKRYTALMQWATALDASAVDYTEGELLSRYRGGVPPILLPACLRGLDLSGTVMASFYPSAVSTAQPVKMEEPPAAVTSNPFSSPLSPTSPRSSVTAAGSSRRVLQLFRPAFPTFSSPTPQYIAPTTARPLINLAVVRAEDVQRLLPSAMAVMLSEEENASRVQIVLQPRLRRFHCFEASSSAVGPSGALKTRATMHSVAGEGGEVEPLFYFIESRTRANLELVLDALKEFLEPVLLYGKERWILSDVDRSPTTITAENDNSAASLTRRDGGRPAVLRMLYENLQTETGKTAKGGAAPGSRFLYKCQVRDGKLREVKERLFSRFQMRADCYYDYPQDRTLHVERLSLASHVRLRPYQVASLERFRRGHKAHQGVVVLPCGAGKTLTGIGAAAAMQKTTIVMCVNNMSVFQWQREFLRWTDLRPEEVTVCTANMKQRPGKVFITTYSMIIAKRGRSDGAAAEESRAILRAVAAQPWGLLLLDEVHTALAHHFQDVLNTIKYKCVLGLSATLLREDDKIGDLRHLVGPKLYEANWLDLTKAGFLAAVECAEVQCPMPLLFLQHYRDLQRARLLLGTGQHTRKRQRRESVFVQEDTDLEEGTGRPRGRRAAHGGISSRALHLASCNPYKLWCTQALLAFHQHRSPPDKVIIFCDYLADVRFFAHHLHLPFMDQRTSEAERTHLLQYFQFSNEVNAIILTRVGDVALDLPCASVIIQVSGLGASRRQEAQRLGRILRPKPPSLDNTCAYFYTLVSQDTGDVRTSYKRQSWLRDQGFAYRILHSDSVLREFTRAGGQPCCVGPPQWWYQAAPRAATSTAATVADDAGLCWVPFSREAAQAIELAFLHGREQCVLSEKQLGTDTVRPSAMELGGYPLRSTEVWTLYFSSTDAPHSFGTVRIGEGPAAGDGASRRVRRVRRGCLDRGHRCAAASEEDACLQYALSVVDRRAGEAASALTGGAEVEPDDDNDDSLSGEEEEDF